MKGSCPSLFLAGKLLIRMVGRNRAERYVAVTKAASARGGTIMYGRSVGENRIMQALALADVRQVSVFTLLDAEAEAVLEAVNVEVSSNPKDGVGVLSRTIPGSGKQDVYVMENAMEPGFKLITVIVNNGYADDVMNAARKAGASGGTILNARGTGTEEDVKCFAITIVPEKAILLIVVATDKVDQVVAAISATTHLCEPGGGIVYTMNVEQFVVLGQ